MQDNKPIVGVIACTRMMDGEPVQRVFHRYLEGVSHHADAIALMVPNFQPAETATAIVDRLDGILLTGSTTNIEPKRYGSTAPGAAPFDPSRDGFATALIHAAIAAGKPLFGICRGLQEINVALGGSLVDLREDGSGRAVTHHAPAEADGAATFAHSHPVAFAEDGVLRNYGAPAQQLVNSVHYQTIDRLAEGLVASAVAPDGVIEAIEAVDTPAPVFAVQWHPEWRAGERPEDLAFWRYLNAATRRAAAGR